MRLGQLSRKLNIKSDEILEFIQKEFNEEIKNHPNCKIPDDFVAPITEHFKKVIEEKAPTEEKLPKKETPVAEATKPEEEAKEVFLEKTEEEFEEALEEVKKESFDPLEEEAKEVKNEAKESNTDKDAVGEIKEEDLNIVDGVIRAPKVESPEVKVVGKIDIQEKKSEEENTEEETESKEENADAENIDVEVAAEKDEDSASPNEGEETVPKPAVKKPVNNKRKSRKPQKKVMTYEEEREKELEKYKKERLAKKKLEKEAKRKAYEEQQKARQKNSPKKKKKKKAAKTKTKQQEVIKEKEEAPKTAWGKFLHWLNT